MLRSADHTALLHLKPARARLPYVSRLPQCTPQQPCIIFTGTGAAADRGCTSAEAQLPEAISLAHPQLLLDVRQDVPAANMPSALSCCAIAGETTDGKAGHCPAQEAEVCAHTRWMRPMCFRNGAGSRAPAPSAQPAERGFSAVRLLGAPDEACHRHAQQHKWAREPGAVHARCPLRFPAEQAALSGELWCSAAEYL